MRFSGTWDLLQMLLSILYLHNMRYRTDPITQNRKKWFRSQKKSILAKKIDNNIFFNFLKKNSHSLNTFARMFIRGYIFFIFLFYFIIILFFYFFIFSKSEYQFAYHGTSHQNIMSSISIPLVFFERAEIKS